MGKEKQTKLLVCKVNIIQRMRSRRTQVQQPYILLTISRKQSDQSVQDYFLGWGGVVKEDILTENAQLKCKMKLPIGITKLSQQTHEMSFFLDVPSTVF